ncbi:MAG: SDR family NAD(P)-dependent oxidoreductase [Armatimonadota bacterium]|nr:SDR family NAD(P)-dependent oxidoreductase [Armatimonadota bacterium]
MDIQDKVTLITGASEGIGLATARRFARAGAKLALVARSMEKLTALADELRGRDVEAIAVPADLRDPANALNVTGFIKPGGNIFEIEPYALKRVRLLVYQPSLLLGDDPSDDACGPYWSFLLPLVLEGSTIAYDQHHRGADSPRSPPDRRPP